MVTDGADDKTASIFVYGNYFLFLNDIYVKYFCSNPCTLTISMDLW